MSPSLCATILPRFSTCAPCRGAAARRPRRPQPGSPAPHPQQTAVATEQRTHCRPWLPQAPVQGRATHHFRVDRGESGEGGYAQGGDHAQGGSCTRQGWTAATRQSMPCRSRAGIASCGGSAARHRGAERLGLSARRPCACWAGWHLFRRRRRTVLSSPCRPSSVTSPRTRRRGASAAWTRQTCAKGWCRYTALACVCCAVCVVVVGPPAQVRRQP
jgi:hypothetical protein